jgi:hypothetical protein
MLSPVDSFLIVSQTEEPRKYQAKKRTKEKVRARFFQPSEHDEEGNEQGNVEQTPTPS